MLIFVRMRACVCACVRACVRVCVRACLSFYVHVSVIFVDGKIKKNLIGSNKLSQDTSICGKFFLAAGFCEETVRCLCCRTCETQEGR